MNLVDKIMDIPCQQSLPDDAPEVAHTAYKLGHREGCWAAVLAAKEFQSQYSTLYEALERIINECENGTGHALIKAIGDSKLLLRLLNNN